MSSAKLEELRKKFDENPRRYFAPLANEYRKVGDFDQAIFICQEYLPQQPGHMSGHIVFGQALFEAKRLPEAKTVFETALSLDPENLIALRHLADISRDLGETASARAWYERVLQADPRNEEIVAIMEQLGASEPEPVPPVATSVVAAATAPTAEVPAKPAPVASVPPAKAAADPAGAAATVVLTAAQVQEMLKARAGTRVSVPAAEPSAPEPEIMPMTLDSTPTVEVRAAGETHTMEGLEPTSLGTMDLPTIEPLGLEPTSLGDQEVTAPAAAPLDGLDTISLEISVPGSAPMTPTVEIPAMSAPSAPAPDIADDGLLDLDTLNLGGAATPAAAPSPTESPIDGGHDSGDLLDLDFPSAPEPAAVPAPAPAEVAAAVPTLIFDAVKSIVPAVREAVEAAVPAVVDAVQSAAPAMMDFVEAAAQSPTVIMEAIKAPAKPEPPPASVSASADADRSSQSVPFVTETMAQLYLSQGHRTEAIDIYRKLIEGRPGDAELRARLAAIEAEENTVTSGQRSSGPAVGAPRRFAGTGPSVRTVLRELFGLDGSTTLANAPSASVPAEVGSIDMLFATDAVAGALSPLALAFDGGYVAAQGTIDELFAGGR